MGCTVGRTKPTEVTPPTTNAVNDPAKVAQINNRMIEAAIDREKKAEQATVKLLLLGGSESGKSTLAKQMKILHMNGFEEAELMNFRYLVYTNVIDIAHLLLLSTKRLQITIDPETEATAVEFEKLAEQTALSGDGPTVFHLIQRIWHSDAVRTCMQRRNELQLPDNVEHFMKSVERIGGEDYTPTNADILHARVSTLGVHETKFIYMAKTFRLIDVGGQKSERRKWLHCFDNVTAILFVAALNGYDQLLVEDNATNRMLDSVNLFASVTNNRAFLHSSTILFLNKSDVFETKILQVPLSVCFKDYLGTDIEDAKEYIKKTFLSGVKDAPPSKEQPYPQKRLVYTHFTNATDTSNVDVVLRATADVILKKAIKSTGVA